MLESLKDLKEVSCGGKIINMGKLREEFPEKFTSGNGDQMDYEWFEKEIRPNYNIYVRDDVDSVALTMMTSPASEGGKGCQLTDLVELALHQLKFFHAKFPCRENAITITKWEEGLMWQKKRTEDREARGVEGKDLQ